MTTGEQQIAKQELKRRKLNEKTLAIMAVFIALSVVGAMLKIPSPVGTIGMDSAPGFFSAIAFGSIAGAVVISIGHLLTSVMVGFPLGIPMHLLIAALMALWAVTFRFVTKKIGLIPAVIVAIFLNGVISSFTMMPMGGMGAVIGIMPFLVVGSAINIVVAAVAYKIINKSNLI